MRRMIVFCLAALMGWTTLGFAWPFLFFPVHYEGTPLTTTCGGGTGIPDGTLGYIFVDWNGNGPDLSDPLAPVCNSTPYGDCAGGERGSLSRNTIEMNGQSVLEMAGYFFAESGIGGYQAMPPVNRFFIRIYYPTRANPSVIWTSEVFSIPSGLTSEMPLNHWRCGGPESGCTLPAPVTITPVSPYGPQHSLRALLTCNGQGPLVKIGPLVRPNRLPVAHITYGCADGNPAGPVVFSNDAWTAVINSGQLYYQQQLTVAPGGTDGCFIFHLDALLPAEMGPVAVVPLDGAVDLSWRTLSETDLAGFEVRRNGAAIHTVVAVNNAGGAQYTYRDHDVDNGHVYTYELVLVNADGSRELVHTASDVVPAASRAVVTAYALDQNYPNPFNPTTSIRFDVAADNAVTLTVYNSQGQRVATLLDAVPTEMGRHTVSFNAAHLPSGLYFYRVKMGNEFTATKKMLLVK